MKSLKICNKSSYKEIENWLTRKVFWWGKLLKGKVDWGLARKVDEESRLKVNWWGKWINLGFDHRQTDGQRNGQR